MAPVRSLQLIIPRSRRTLELYIFLVDRDTGAGDSDWRPDWFKYQRILAEGFCRMRAQNPDLKVIFGEVHAGRWGRVYRELLVPAGGVECECVQSFLLTDDAGERVVRTKELIRELWGPLWEPARDEDSGPATMMEEPEDVASLLDRLLLL
ncbi:uncharacterized protein BP01DRAFT_6670 [Aspergillus saccharolyticus JOP 1030-1]|uniref:Uncharacterized protein n=1 Tax=Aspergillus saccharolyticus JOP 1030-1 TaxID=1450539 RepID=A0A318ZT23_9EURO|nr:hypothetical protein BP01DRAFT_6670 [Aspergillus saccharolyticus JOP 1030-1]PYH49794.1 hypothetical protein BP01DRAFT_6670 [Aspergillus saccharolyticus JOP 1030-1]